MNHRHQRGIALGASCIFLSFGLSLACSPKGDDSPNGGSGRTGGTSGSGGSASGDGETNISFDSGSETPSGDVVECAEGEANAQPVPANLLFVVDKSGSMNCNPPPTDATCLIAEKKEPSEASKWEITKNALTGSNGALPTLAGQEGVSVGLLAFPTDDNCAVPDEGELTVPIAELSEAHLSALSAGLGLEAEGQTPLAGAAIRGLHALRRGMEDKSLQGSSYLVVMTDGSETCQVSALQDLLFFVEQANYYYGIKTFAIGAPGSEASRDLLSEIAALGDTRRSDDCEIRPTSAAESCHIDLTESEDFESDLGAEFLGITETAAGSCLYDVPDGALVDLKKVNVEYTAPGEETQTVPQDPGQSGALQCEGAEGWQFTEDQSQIVLCGRLCDEVIAEPESDVRVVFGCQDTVVR